MSDAATTEARQVTLPDLRDLLKAFVFRASDDRDLATRFIAARAGVLMKEVSSVLDRNTDRMPEVEAGIRELRLKELHDQRRKLSQQIDALDAEERSIRSLDKSA
ncbi:hypothetical protein [Bradyrhizobium liaoningense]|uniref:hypothetical protein n=1 Tax=Bradyrhizobium liaoningense TaxID=43992 RepID=UPI001BA7E356|nr:hypothetical protein [Bradyrhizobium liaoningense]MBR0855462.1 hypothetical protein [Bradyrhizobium liaoningense]